MRLNVSEIYITALYYRREVYVSGLKLLACSLHLNHRSTQKSVQSFPLPRNNPQFPNDGLSTYLYYLSLCFIHTCHFTYDNIFKLFVSTFITTNSSHDS